MAYSKLIKVLREKLMLTQTEFANLLGVSFVSINRWENDKNKPNMKIRRKIIELCKENQIDIDSYSH